MLVPDFQEKPNDFSNTWRSFKKKQKSKSGGTIRPKVNVKKFVNTNWDNVS